MELLEKYFAELIQCVDASYLVIGIILVFLSVPDTADYAPYRKAKYFLASAFFCYVHQPVSLVGNLFLARLEGAQFHHCQYGHQPVFPDMYMLCLFVCLPVGFAIYQ
nr:hypothetical protein [uncultured Prevotella sp.]